MRAHSILRRIHVAGGAILMATLGSSRLAAVDADPNPYGVIVERNVFQLKPPPLPSTAPATETADLPVVAFCGTMAIGDQVRALMVVATSEANKNNRSASKETKAMSYLNLAPGETGGPVRLVRIHQDRQAVDILVAGTERTLTMKDDGTAKMALAAPVPSSKTTTVHPNAGARILTSVAHNLRGEQGIDASAGGNPVTIASEAGANDGANQGRPMGVVASSGNTIVTGNNGGDQSQPNGLPGNSALQANASSGVIVSGAIPLLDGGSTSPSEEPPSPEDPAVKYHWQRTIPWLIDVTAPPAP
jgi:hypothetical protein